MRGDEMRSTRRATPRSANYSPVRQMNHQHINYQPQSSSSSSSSSGPSHRNSADNFNDAPATSQQARSLNHLHRSANEPDEDDDDDDDVENQARKQQQQLGQDRSHLEEVYLCDCCGVTRQLDPAMKYMRLFQSLFFFFNFLVFAFGWANLAVGLWFRIDPKVYEIHKYIETQNFTIAGWILLFGGAFAILMALAGCLATSRQALGGLLLYLAAMVALTVSLVASLVLLTVFGLGSQLERFLVKEIYEQIRRRTMNTEVDLFMNTDAAQFMDFVQVKMRCCGATDFRDYQKLGMVIPTTCYTIAGNYINAPGCGRAIRELLDVRAGLATAFATGGAIAQLLTILLASLIVCSIYNWRASPRPATPTDMEGLPHVDDDLTHLKQLQRRLSPHDRPITSIRV